jgi:tryptophanyl-tRNA synthetase
MQRVFSGIQPSGVPTLGNYLGAIRNWVPMQDQHESLFCIVDLHAITGAGYDPSQLQQRTRDMSIGLLAAGVDPNRVTLFVQSHVPEHAQLTWLLNAVTPLGELERMTQFKDKSQQLESIPAGLLNYPILMAADILLYRADLVPVGEDQLQHLELAREVARRWNAAFTPSRVHFPEPQPMLSTARRIMGLDGDSKMSKSKGNTVGVLDTPDEIWAKLRPAKTDPARVTKKDPGNPEVCNLYDLHRHFSPPATVAEVADKCRTAGWGCIECKRVLADHMIATLAPIRAKALELKADPARVDELLADGAAGARRVARETLRETEDAMGFLPARPGVISEA